MKKLLISSAIAVFLASTLVSPYVGAQSQQDLVESITLSPVSRKYALDAGATVQDKFTIVNDGKTAYDFVVYSRPYSVNDESYEPNFTSTPQNADAYGWVRFSKTKFHLEAGATIDVGYSIAVPKQAKPGGHYGVIFAETQPTAEAINGNSVVRKKRVGSILYATVKGEFITKGQVDATSIPFWQFQPPLRAEAKVTNGGNSDFGDATVYRVKDVFGNTKYAQTKEYTILPGTTRKMMFDWKGASWFGLYKVELEQTVLGKKTTESGFVLILPRYVPVLLVVILLIGGAYAWFRHKKK